MPNTIVKLERERQNLVVAAEAIATSHRKLIEELPVFFSKRIDYFQPTLQVQQNKSHLSVTSKNVMHTIYKCSIPNISDSIHRQWCELSQNTMEIQHVALHFQSQVAQKRKTAKLILQLNLRLQTDKFHHLYFLNPSFSPQFKANQQGFDPYLLLSTQVRELKNTKDPFETVIKYQSVNCCTS